MSEEEKKAIEIVKQFNNENRYRDCGRINNAIDTVIRLAEKLEQEKEKNKALKEGLKYRINYCKLLEKELYANGVNYKFEKTEIEKQFLEE